MELRVAEQKKAEANCRETHEELLCDLKTNEKKLETKEKEIARMQELLRVTVCFQYFGFLMMV